MLETRLSQRQINHFVQGKCIFVPDNAYNENGAKISPHNSSPVPPQTSLAQRKARSTSMTAAGESLRAYVIKMLRQVEESRGDGSEREGRRHYVGEGLSDRISL